MVKSVRALERGLNVLERVREARSVTLNDLHLRTKLSRATLLRALKTLEQRGWVQSGHEDGAYRPGPKMYAATTGSHRRTLPDLAVPILNELGRKVIWPSDIGVCRGHSMLILESSRRNSPFVINRKAVGRRPSLLKSAMGRAYLAFCPPQERERLIERLRRSTDPDDRVATLSAIVGRILQDTRMRGYGVREPGYWAGADDYGGDVSSIAVPVMIGESIVACISLLWVSGASTVEEFAHANLKPLTEAAAKLARCLEQERNRRSTINSRRADRL
jgi:IclR family transcriptional regulator, mhp operon transcriptional activator